MQELFLVVGGELSDISDQIDFRDPDALDIVGIYSDRPAAQAAWRANAQRTVDNAHMRYFVIPFFPGQGESAK